MKRNIFNLLLLVLLSGFAGIGVYHLVTGGGVVLSSKPNATPDTSAKFDMHSEDLRLLIPRMTTEQRNQIPNPAIGLQIFNIDKGNIEYFDGKRWDALGTPIGTIQPFAGDTSQIPKGWLLCDGRLLKIDPNNIYYDLYLRIGKSWGGNATHFRVPDLRGLFLRGADLGAGRDPDINLRIALYSGGNSGQDVGSYQFDEFKKHRHLQPAANTGCGLTWTYAYWALPEPKHTDASDHCGMASGDNAGGNETRPKNVYVNYIIKY